MRDSLVVDRRSIELGTAGIEYPRPLKLREENLSPTLIDRKVEELFSARMSSLFSVRRK